MTRLMSGLLFASNCLLTASFLSADVINVPGDFPTIQTAIEAASDGDIIIVQPGIYPGTVNPLGKAIEIRSSDPSNPQIVATTVIDGEATEPAVEIIFGEGLTTIIDGFTITGGLGDNGGGISIFASDPVVRRCVVRDNTADKGGGVYLVSSSALFDRCTFADNSATDGGGVYNYASPWPRFDGCEFIDNIASSRGGGIASNFGTGRYDRCLIAGNQAANRGGGFWGTNAGPLVVSTIIRDNIAPTGAALQADDAGYRLANVTIVQNVATNGSGGFIDGIFSQPLVRNSIVRDNGAEPVKGFSVNPAVEYSNFEGGANGPGNIDVDPMFVDAANNDFRLLPNSPSINAGFNGWVSSYSLDDRDDTPRIQDATVDMGAFESEGAVDPLPPKQGQLVVGLKDDGNLAFGLPLPLVSYDPDSGQWIELVRNLPAFAVAADVQGACYWVHNGETGMLNRVPFATLRPEEIGVIKGNDTNALSLSGMAVRNGVLYATTGPFGIQALYTIDCETARATMVTAIDSLYDVWDLEYDATTDRMLFLSSAGFLPTDPMGVYAIDLNSFEVTQVQQWINFDPTNEAPALQGLAVGNGRNYLLRSLYNDLEVYDALSLQLVDELSLPDSVPGNYWVLGGLTWTGSSESSQTRRIRRTARSMTD